MTSLLKFALGGASAAVVLLAAASAANAAVTVDGFTLDTGSFGAQTGVHSAGSPPGATLYGFVNQDGSQVVFSTSSGALSFGNGGGEATINGDPLIENLNVAFAKSWNSVTFNLGSDKKVTSAFNLLVNGAALFSASPNPGDPPCAFCIVNNGENKFTVTGPGIYNLAFTFNPAIASAKQFRVEGLSSGVPEPATWAMMIGGFGLAGVALRRRRMIAAVGA